MKQQYISKYEQQARNVYSGTRLCARLSTKCDLITTINSCGVLNGHTMARNTVGSL